MSEISVTRSADSDTVRVMRYLKIGEPMRVIVAAPSNATVAEILAGAQDKLNDDEVISLLAALERQET